MNDPSNPLPLGNAKEFYLRRITELDSVIDDLKGTDRRCAQVRGFAFLVFVGFIAAGIIKQSVLGAVIGALAFIALVAFIFYHERVERRLAIKTALRHISRRQVARIERNWATLPKSTERPSSTIDELPLDRSPTVLDESVAVDLDLFGSGSLWQLVSQAYTPFGERVLHDWFLTPADAEKVKRRQAAVQRLAPMVDFREQLALHGSMLASMKSDPTEFVAWAQGPKWLGQRTWLIWMARVFGLLMIVSLVLPVFGGEWLLATLAMLIINVVINAIWAGSVHDLFNRISDSNYDMVHYAALLEAVNALPDDTPKLAELKSQMQIVDVSFRTAFSQLQRLVYFSNGRKSRLFWVPWMIVHIFFFWDFHVLERLERWQSRFGADVARWFDAVGQLEALVSLATLAHDQPNWSFPSVDDACEDVAATAMGHPLLPQDQCVRNDLSVGPSGTFLLVTGSNMSGKSTLLRSLGVNAVLALSGAPVCAEQFSLPPVELATSMRITDSLNSGVSFFMAELQRLKNIVDRAREISTNKATRMLYLLDEILQGTNSAERHVAVTRVIGHLLDCRTLGAVSTHDLELAGASELASRCQLVHLRETIRSGPEGDSMTFDYVVRPGVTPTTNALKLLEMVGLGDNL